MPRKLNILTRERNIHAMSLKKMLAKSAVGFIFSLFLTFSVLYFSLFQITDKDTLKPIALAIASNQVSKEQIEQTYTFITQRCGDEKSIELTFQDEKILINCE